VFDNPAREEEKEKKKKSVKQKTSEIGEPGQARLENPKKHTFESNRHVEFQPPKLARPESRNSILTKNLQQVLFFSLSLCVCVSKNVIKFSLYFLLTFQMTWHFHLITSGSKVSVRNNNPARPSTSKNQCKVV
jgi:hypothetical protein